MKSRALLLLVSLSLPVLAQDAIYKWKEPDGTEHYTNDLNAVPTNRAVIPTRGGDLSQVVHTSGVAPKPPTERDLALRKAEAEARKAESDAKTAAMQAAHAETQSETHWRALFQAARARVTALQSELERERAVLAPANLPIQGRINSFDLCQPYGVCPVAVVDPLYERAVVRVRQLEQELKVARDEHQDLERRASYAAVPRHWRQ